MEFDRPQDLETHMTEIVDGYWAVRASSRMHGADYVGDVIEPAIRQLGADGVRLLERFADSDDPDSRTVAATLVTELSPAVPREALVALINRLLIEEKPGRGEEPGSYVLQSILESLFEYPVRDDLSWNDLREALYPHIKGHRDRR